MYILRYNMYCIKLKIHIMKRLPIGVLALIASYVIDSTTSTKTIHKYMFIDPIVGKTFGAQYIQFLRKKHNETDICKVFAKEIHKKSINNYQSLQRFDGNERIVFENVKVKGRYLIYLLAIYHGYIWFNTTISSGYKFAYSLDNYLDDHTEPYSYRELCIKKLYSKEIFRRDADVCYLQPGAQTYKKDVVWRIDSIKLLKI